MPTNDNFKGVNFTAGQEVRAQDLIDSQLFLVSKLMDQLIDQLTPGPRATTADNPDFRSQSGLDSPTGSYAYCLSVGDANPKLGSANNKVKIAAGTLFQKIAAQTGNEQTLLAYTFPGTDELTIANGSGANPRVDLIQMKLELITTDSQSRVTATAGVKASRDLNPLTANCETVIRARAAGFGGNAISIAFVADGAGAGSLTQSGYALTFHYQSGVTTVANFETAVAASALIEVQTVDGVGTLTSPGDTFAAVYLTGGTDQVLSSSNVNMKRRVQCTLNIKQGTAANPPVFPAPDAGCVPIAAVLVGGGYNGTPALGIQHQLSAAGANEAYLMDLRMPISVRRYFVYAKEGLFDSDAWAIQSGAAGGMNRSVKRIAAGAAQPSLCVPCPVVNGRLIGIGIISKNMTVAGNNAILNSWSAIGGGGNGIAVITSLLEAGAANVMKRGGFDKIENTPLGGAIVPTATSPHGAPIWCNGCNFQQEPKLQGTLDEYTLVAQFANTASAEVMGVEFLVAQGL